MQRQLERTIWIATIGIMAAGLVTLYSASQFSVRVTHKIFYDQLFMALIGLALMFFLSRFDYKRFFDGANLLYWVTAVLLVLVLVLGRNILGAKRWIEFGGINFQPSELAKFSLILILARYFSQRKNSFSSSSRGLWETLFQDLFSPLFLTLVLVLLIFKQPDLGTAISLFFIFLVMLFLSGIRYRYFLSFVALILAVMPFFWHILKPYQKDRLLVFLNPNIDPLGAGYTIIQSKIAVGSGGLLGKGWLSGTQNQLNFLPERHTDFIFSVVGEEWGLAGSLLVAFLFFVLVNCSFRIIQNTKDRFGFLAGVGIVSIIAFQVVINIGMVLGLCPVVGITLPLVSYGRSSFMVFVVMIGFLLSLNKKRMMF
ncbi:MAG: rod shape-determining protein RodA [Candidatus Omnitrophota bacterium]